MTSGIDARGSREPSRAAAVEASFALAPTGRAVVFDRASHRIVDAAHSTLGPLPWPTIEVDPNATLFDLIDPDDHAELTRAIDRARVTSMTRATLRDVLGQPHIVAISSFGDTCHEAIAILDEDSLLRELVDGEHSMRSRLHYDLEGRLIGADASPGIVGRVEHTEDFGGELISAPDRAAFRKAVDQVIAGEPYARLRLDGAAPGLHLEVIVASASDTIVVDLFDQSHEEQAFAALARSQEQFDQLSETLPVGVFVVGAGGSMEFHSERLRELFGPVVATDYGWIEAVHVDDRPLLEAALAQLPDRRNFSVDVRGIRPDGETGWFRLAGSDIRDGDGTLKAVVGFVEDITERRDLHRRVEFQAAFDPLTELPNRATLIERLRSSLERRHATRTAVLFIDLDGFKLVNDTQGHNVGDIVLVEVADRFRRAARLEDTIGRFGGDEFLVVAEIHDVAEAEAIARRIHDSLTTPVLADGRIITINASIGVALSEETSSSEQLIGDADIAMYEAKGSGNGSTVVFDASLRSRAAQRFDMTADLRHARRRRELRLEYQPIIELATNRLVGAEGLVRWDHPTMGRIHPGTFVPLAEEIGLIDDIGEWVVEQACADLDRLRSRALIDDEFVISINASAQQFNNVATLATSSLAALDQHGLVPSCIRFELTESVPLTQIPEAATRIRQLTSYGFGLAIDDFGTGYSSLGYLTMLPFDVLKLDLSLIAQLQPGSPAMAVVDSLTRMAREMQFTIVAEGIENDKQQTLLHQAGVHYGQGYYISRPVTLGGLMDRLEESQMNGD